ARILSRDDDQFQARCRGSGEHDYQQWIRLGSRGVPLLGRCNCPVGHNCKHCAAALFLAASEAPRLAPRLIEDLQPTAQLALGSHLQSIYQPGNRRTVQRLQHRAALSFDYAGQRTHGRQASGGERLRLLLDGQAASVARQPEAEQRLRQQLESFGLRPAMRQSQALPPDSGEMYELANDADWLRFVQQGLPRLRELGWRIDMRPGFRFDL